jgi:hypothetical protein
LWSEKFETEKFTSPGFGMDFNGKKWTISPAGSSNLTGYRFTEKGRRMYVKNRMYCSIVQNFFYGSLVIALLLNFYLNLR